MLDSLLNAGTLYIIAFLAGLLGAADYFGFTNILPTTKKTAGLVALIGIGVAGVGAGWWSGVIGEVAVEEEVGPAPTPQLVTVDVVSSDSSDAQITKESDKDRYWKTEFYWDGTATQENYAGDDTELTQVVADLDLIWSAAAGAENDVYTFKIGIGSVPTVENVDDASFDEKKVVSYDTTEDEYKITVNPSGGSTQRMEAYASVTPGGSTTVTVTFPLAGSSDWGKHVEKYDSLVIPVQIDTNADGQYDTSRVLRLMRTS